MRVDIPNVENPVDPNVLPYVWLKVKRVGAGTPPPVTIQLEGHYYEINTTAARNSSAYPLRTVNDATTAITLGTNRLNIYTTMGINIKVSTDIVHHDVIVLKFPLFWTFQTPVTISDVNTNTRFKEFWSISNIE
jgi:hypothetical protein